MFNYSSINLPNPRFEDTRRINLNNIIRGGRFLANYKNDPTVTVFLYKFLIHDCQLNTTGSLVEEFKQKLIETTGNRITWVDHLGVSRDGFLVTDEPEFVTVSTDWVEVTIELMEDLE